LMPAMIFLLCVAPDLLSTVFGSRYGTSAAVFRVYLLLLPMRTLAYGAILQATGQSRHIFYQTILALAVNACVGWFAVGYFGAIGAAMVMVTDTYLTYIPYNVIILRRTLHCPIRGLFPWGQLFRVIAASCIGAVPVIAVNHYAQSWPALLRLAVSGSLYVPITLLIFSRSGWLGSLNPMTHLGAIADFVRRNDSDGSRLEVRRQAQPLPSSRS
jgi:O-antigen/teichoic acid export membrane protein